MHDRLMCVILDVAVALARVIYYGHQSNGLVELQPNYRRGQERAIRKISCVID
jgi:hypothetical protein